MLTQLSTVGRSIRRAPASKRGVKSLHSAAAVQAKSVKPDSANVEEVPILSSTFSELLATQIDSYPHKDTYEAAIEDLKWTTQQLNWHTYAVTGSLHGFPSARKLAYTAQGALRGEVLVGMLAAPQAGKLFALVPPFRASELINDLKKSSAQFLLFIPKIGKKVQLDDLYEIFPSRSATDGTEHISDPRVPNLHTIVHTAKKDLHGLLHHSDFQAPHYYKQLIKNSLTADEVSTLVLDGSEFAAFTQNNLINAANAMGAGLGIDSTTTTVCGISPTTTQGLMASFMLPIVRRSKLVVPSDDPTENMARIYESISRHGANNVVADAVTWEAILNGSQPAQAKAFASAIKSGVVVGDNSVVDAELVKAIRSTLGVSTIHVTHGSARTTGITLINGRPIANTQAKLVDENGKDSSSSGFLAVKGVNVFQGYYNDGVIDKSSIKDGWVTTDIKAEQTGTNTFSVLRAKCPAFPPQPTPPLLGWEAQFAGRVAKTRDMEEGERLEDVLKELDLDLDSPRTPVL